MSEQTMQGLADAYRTADASGSPEAAEVVAWNWISDVAQAQRNTYAGMLEIVAEPVEGGGKVTRLYRGSTLLAVATTFRDAMNFTVLVRWLCPELRTQPATGLSEQTDVERRKHGSRIGEYLPQDCEPTPEAAAKRIIAYLEWEGSYEGEWGPAMYYADLRILADAALSPERVENERLREALERIANARMAIDGGSIAECRRIASKALANTGEGACPTTNR